VNIQLSAILILVDHFLCVCVWSDIKRSTAETTGNTFEHFRTAKQKLLQRTKWYPPHPHPPCPLTHPSKPLSFQSTAEDTASEKTASKQYGSGTVGGAGFGNKSNADPSDLDHSDTRFGTGHKVDPYSGASKYGSGATAGVGAGNKMQAVSSGEAKEEEEEERRYGLSGNKVGRVAGAGDVGVMGCG
jgi:hypothetical protein